MPKYPEVGNFLISWLISYSHVTKVEILTIDEHINSYQPRKETKEQAERDQEPIPVVYIPRKPHKNGLLTYFANSYLNTPQQPDKNLPIILDMIPHLRVGDSSAVQAAETILKRLIYFLLFQLIIIRWFISDMPKPHVVLDAGFSSFSMLNFFKQYQWPITMSVAKSMEPYLWRLLSHKIPPDYWQAAYSDTVGVASLHKIIDPNGKLVAQQVVSNAIKPTSLLKPPELSAVEENPSNRSIQGDVNSISVVGSGKILSFQPCVIILSFNYFQRKFPIIHNKN
jgi:hypothetical protein